MSCAGCAREVRRGLGRAALTFDPAIAGCAEIGDPVRGAGFVPRRT